MPPIANNGLSVAFPKVRRRKTRETHLIAHRPRRLIAGRRALPLAHHCLYDDRAPTLAGLKDREPSFEDRGGLRTEDPGLRRVWRLEAGGEDREVEVEAVMRVAVPPNLARRCKAQSRLTCLSAGIGAKDGSNAPVTPPEPDKLARRGVGAWVWAEVPRIWIGFGSASSGRFTTCIYVAVGSTFSLPHLIIRRAFTR